jgi:hypothetical protein
VGLTTFNLTVPAGAGTGSASDVSSVSASRTLMIHGAFTGTIAIEGSDDGTNFDSIVGTGRFEVGGIYPLDAAARFVRVRRAGNVSGTPGVALVGDDTTLSAEEAPAAASAVTSVAAAASTTTLLAANTNRRMATFFNDTSGRTLYLKYGSGASTSSYTVKIREQGYFEMPAPVEIGIITGIWDAGSGGSVRITEST